MTIANWCVLTACLLPIITVGLAKAGSATSATRAERYDNNNPREWATRLTGWQQRALAAQNNGWEALPLFIAAVVLTQQAHADQGRIDLLAMSFIGIVAYRFGKKTERNKTKWLGVVMMLYPYVTGSDTRLLYAVGIILCVAIYFYRHE